MLFTIEMAILRAFDGKKGLGILGVIF